VSLSAEIRSVSTGVSFNKLSFLRKFYWRRMLSHPTYHRLKLTIDAISVICFALLLILKMRKILMMPFHLKTLPDGNFRLGVAHCRCILLCNRRKRNRLKKRSSASTSVISQTALFPCFPKNSPMACAVFVRMKTAGVHCFQLNVTPRGSIKEYEIVESVIRSKQRFSYERVAGIDQQVRTGSSGVTE